MLIKLTTTQLLMGLFEKFFRLHDPQTPLYQENITISYPPKGPDQMGDLSLMFRYHKTTSIEQSNLLFPVQIQELCMPCKLYPYLDTCSIHVCYQVKGSLSSLGHCTNSRPEICRVVEQISGNRAGWHLLIGITILLFHLLLLSFFIGDE